MLRILSTIFIMHISLVFAQNAPFESTPLPPQFTNPDAILKMSGWIDSQSNIDYLVIDEQDIFYCDNSYSIMASISIHRHHNIIVSKGGNYLFLSELFDRPEEKSDPSGEERFYLIDNKERTKTLVKQKPLIWDDMNHVQYLISDVKGHYFEYTAKNTVIKTYDQSGNPVSEVTLFEDARSRPAYMDISRDGKLIVVAASKRHAKAAGINSRTPVRGRRAGETFVASWESATGEPHIFVFNSVGALKKQIPLPYDDVSSVIIGSTGNITAVTVHNIKNNGRRVHKVAMYDSTMSLLFTIPHLMNTSHFSEHYFSGFYFDDDGDRLITVYDIADGSQLISFKIESNIMAIVSASKSSGSIKILVKLDEEYWGPYKIIETSMRTGKVLAESTIFQMKPSSVGIGKPSNNSLYRGVIITDKNSRKIISY